MDQTVRRAPVADGRFRALFEQSPISTAICAPDGRPLAVNAAFTRLWGLALSDLPPGYSVLGDPQLAAAGLLPLVARAFAGEEVRLPPFRYDAAPLAGGARARWTEAFLAPISDADGRVREVVLTQFDVTARVEAAHDLQAAEALARGQLEALSRTVGQLADSRDLDALPGHVLAEIARQAGAAVGHIFAYDAADNTLALQATVRQGNLSREPWPDDPPLFHAPFAADVTSVVANLRTTRELGLMSAGQFEGWAWPGTMAWHSAQGHQDAAVLGLLAGDELVGVLGLGFYRTPQLAPADTQLIQTLGQQAALALQLTRLARDARQLAVLEERTRLAREIHDTLAQGFTGIIVQLQAAAEVATSSPAGQRAHLARAIDLARASLAEARRSVLALRAPALVDTDLASALRGLLRQITDEGPMMASLAVSGAPVALPPEVESQLLRIGQEAVANVVQHAAARALEVELCFLPGQVMLVIRDDGAGFEPAQVGASRYGLVGMGERARQIGAELAVESAPGQGTTITAMAPLATKGRP